MSDTIARLYVELGVKDAALKSGLAGAKQSLGGVAGSFLQTTAKALLTAGAIQKVGQAFKDTLQDTMAYGRQIMDISRLTGDSAEDASRLIQVADDVKLSYEKLNTSLMFAAKNGYDASLSGIKKMAVEYNKLEPGIERVQFLTERFGRAGAEMGKMLEQGATGIDAMAESAEKAGQVLGGETVYAIRQAEIAIDDFEDKIEGMKYQIGGGVIPVILKLNETAQENRNIFRSLPTTIYAWIDAIKNAKEEAELFKYALEVEQNTENDPIKNRFLSIAEGAELAAERIRAAAQSAEKELELFLQGPVRDENKDYKGKMADNAESIKEVKDQLRELGADPGITDEQLGQIGKFQSNLTGAWVELKNLEDLAGQGEYAFRPMAGALDALREKGIDEATIQRVGELHTTIMAAEIGIRKMGGLPYVTAEQREQIDALKEQLGELEGAQVQIGVEHRNNAKQMVFDMMQQQMAADGMSEAESDALMSLAGNLGLADEQTMALYESSKDFTDQLMSAQTKADALGVSIEELPEYKKIVIDLKTIGATNIFSQLDNIGGAASGGGGGGSGFATGGSFMVGGSGGTDTQPVAFWATPGERVTVETPAQQARGGGGETVIYNRFYGPVSLQSLASVPKTRKTSMLGQMR